VENVKNYSENTPKIGAIMRHFSLIHFLKLFLIVTAPLSFLVSFAGMWFGLILTFSRWISFLYLFKIT